MYVVSGFTLKKD